jgi:hypothetical protein
MQPPAQVRMGIDAIRDTFDDIRQRLIIREPFTQFPHQDHLDKRLARP